MPPIQPVSDIITAGSNSITTQVTALFNTALKNVQTAINTSSFTVVPDVVTAITNGNTTLSQGISATFVQALSNISLDIRIITNTGNTGTTNNINTEVAALLQSISDRLTTIDNAVIAAVTEGAAQNINLVITAVTNANNNVYTQLVSAHNDL